MGQIIAIVILFILVIFEYSMIKANNNKLKRQKRRYDHLLRGKNPDINLEELILQLNDQIEQSNREIKSLDQRSSDTKNTTMGAAVSYTHLDCIRDRAEAVLDIINSTNELSQKQGLKHLSGLLREKIEEIRNIELEALSRIEYSINFTEEDVYKRQY